MDEERNIPLDFLERDAKIGQMEIAIKELQDEIEEAKRYDEYINISRGMWYQIIDRLEKLEARS